MYFMPASCAICTHASASNWTGSNVFANCSYSVTGICARFMIHSPMPGDRLALPFAGGNGNKVPSE